MQIIAALVLALALASAADVATAQPPRSKMALVIGNGDYDGSGAIDVSPASIDAATAAGLIPDLANPVNDGALIRGALEAAGFSVRYVENADFAALGGAIAQFIEETRHIGRDGLAVFYFAGHGVTIDGRPYLAPVGARVPVLPFTQYTEREAGGMAFFGDPRGAPARAQILSSIVVPVSAAIAILPAYPDAPGCLIILDNCRDNPWRSDFLNGGILALMDESGFGTDDYAQPARLPPAQRLYPTPNGTTTTTPPSVAAAATYTDIRDARRKDERDFWSREEALRAGRPLPEASVRHANPYVIAYAASVAFPALDGAGVNSPFAMALSRNMRRPDISIQQMLDDTAKDVRRATRRKQTPTRFPFAAPGYTIQARSPIYEECIVSCAAVSQRR